MLEIQMVENCLLYNKCVNVCKLRNDEQKTLLIALQQQNAMIYIITLT